MITFIDEVEVKNQTVILRVDFNVSLNDNHSLANDERIRQAIPTIKHLLAKQNKLVICSHLGQPKGYDETYSMENVAVRLQKCVDVPVTFYGFDGTRSPEENLARWTTEIATLSDSIAVIDNLRFFPGEKTNDATYAAALARLGTVYVNDAFGVSHRPDGSIVGVAGLLPHYAGLLMKKEITMIGSLMQSPAHPFIAIIGGAKVDTKLQLITRLTELADLVLIGGKLALEKGLPVLPTIETPTDYTYGNDRVAYDIGPETIKKYQSIISTAKTIMWNGPMGKNEDPAFALGTTAIYEAIVANPQAVSVIGGGDTITALSHESHLDRITHLSTGGGAMLEYIEKGTLVGIEALKM